MVDSAMERLGLTFRGTFGLLALAIFFPAARAELVASYSFDVDLNDGSVKGNDLLISSGSPAITAVADEVRVGTGALDLDQSGTEEHLLFGEAIRFDPTDSWSVAWWGKRSRAALDSQGMIVGTTADSFNFIWTPDNSSVVRGLRVRDGSGASIDFGDLVDDHAYHHWAVVYDGTGQVAVWRDNVPLGSRSFPGDLLMTHVGAGTATIKNSFFGQIDELRIYDEAITAATISELFTREDDPAPVRRIEVILLGGQSNADGRALPSALPTSPVNLQEAQSGIDLYDPEAGGLTTLRPLSRFGPEITLGRRLSRELARDPSVRLALFKSARGGTDLASDWQPGGDGTTAGDGPEYRTFQQVVADGRNALAAAYPDASIKVRGMLWVQGERDAKTNQAAKYKANLTAFIADVRLTYGADLGVVISRLSDGQTNIGASDLTAIREAQTAVAAAHPRTALLNTDGFGMQADELHFNAPGQQALGDQAAIELLNFHPFLVAPSLSRQGDDTVQVSLEDVFQDFVYTLQTNTTLEPGGWIDVESKVALGNEMAFSLSPQAEEEGLFFRIARAKP